MIRKVIKNFRMTSPFFQFIIVNPHPGFVAVLRPTIKMDPFQYVYPFGREQYAKIIRGVIIQAICPFYAIVIRTRFWLPSVARSPNRVLPHSKAIMQFRPDDTGWLLAASRRNDETWGSRLFGARAAGNSIQRLSIQRLTIGCGLFPKNHSSSH